ncbi:FAD-binding and (Fe-S)-binding domain-containing protein [Chitinophaga sancti]|uniref:FAD-linked oxidase C-terminal domain-containing protein n=1 Tax=Chitinophaga sancti TaxID=1004 RepID=A0A1K1MSY6_9BACT|nr:FAD-binding and (Fe-S)-binding domain-containing protein [Chitinophaga sancti]WQD62951.1 FAD-linked oxidase C-terminal domain-containing protein [Chitinophaga sancti]WQG91424.1 FAD-linked oxidase C-terminal domain-containing protein [Chitinophaga sancti]SFW26207.1 FAD/FMN-containing dehydrogenase [Chitinophaga sancti]
MREKLRELAGQFTGTLYTDDTMRTLYATDASAYREMPLAVAIPANEEDIKTLIRFARANKTSLIPRTAGTSLAGQVVGNGIVVDVSRTFTKILEINTDEHWVRVQPGVIRDELNMFLQPYGFYFGPETSTANRAMIGGMVGNNSCGSNSVVYGSVREHLLEVKAILSDGSDVTFNSISVDEFHARCEKNDGSLETAVYKQMRTLLGNHSNQDEIRREFPKPSILRRNTGYAVDLLLETAPFTAGKEDFNFCKLIAGSEGTLAFLTEIKIHVDPLPPKETGLLCVHFNNIDESLRANIIAMQYKPSASELIDHYILECTKDNIEQSKNRFFVQGDPGAILVVEFLRDTREEVTAISDRLVAELKAAGLGYHFPLLFGADSKKIWTLRKAGLGLLSNLPGDEKAVPVIEDTAVDIYDLPDYIRDFNEVLKANNLYCVHYAHAGSGEIHLRPIINLKTAEGNALFRKIAEEIATLVKKYKGSLSGEHGDGRLRGEFIRQMIGDKNYELLRDVKYAWDPENIFNPSKIVDTPSMNSMLRYTPGQQTPPIQTVFHFPEQTILQHAEQCNGSGDCRKTQLSGGTMCPSYMATRNEKDTTRARANILREFLTHSNKENRFDHKEIKEVLDLCLACKGCKSECPSNVDMAKLKMEFLQHYYDANGVPFRAKLISNYNRLNGLAQFVPGIYNWMINTKATGNLIKKTSGFAKDRSLPGLQKITLRRWFKRAWPAMKAQLPVATKKVYLFCDEFTNFNDTHIGIKAVQLLYRLGYDVVMIDHPESARAWLSKGLLRKARVFAEQNVQIFSEVINDDMPLLGIEPSAILSFRDEYPDLVREELRASAKTLAKNVFLIDEFLNKEAEKGNIKAAQFTTDKKQIKLHGHCQQKALSSAMYSKNILSLPAQYSVEVIPSGCCGMAGSFGYEKEHYDLSMQIGELVLFPAVRSAANETLIAAPGTSCRHQVKDGTGKKAMHPIEILFDALK